MPNTILKISLLSYSQSSFIFVQNDLVHGWGLDMKLGYCAQVKPTFLFLG